jgi:hypothetical protein
MGPPGRFPWLTGFLAFRFIREGTGDGHAHRNSDLYGNHFYSHRDPNRNRIADPERNFDGNTHGYPDCHDHGHFYDDSHEYPHGCEYSHFDYYPGSNPNCNRYSDDCYTHTDPYAYADTYEDGYTNSDTNKHRPADQYAHGHANDNCHHHALTHSYGNGNCYADCHKDCLSDGHGYFCDPDPNHHPYDYQYRDLHQNDDSHDYIDNHFDSNHDLHNDVHSFLDDDLHQDLDSDEDHDADSSDTFDRTRFPFTS